MARTTGITHQTSATGGNISPFQHEINILLTEITLTGKENITVEQDRVNARELA